MAAGTALVAVVMARDRVDSPEVAKVAWVVAKEATEAAVAMEGAPRSTPISHLRRRVRPGAVACTEHS